MNDRMTKMRLLDLIAILNLPKEEFTILSTSSMVIRGGMKDSGNLDIAVSKKGFDLLNKKYKLEKKDNGWYYVRENVYCRIDDMYKKKEFVEGYYLQDIKDYLQFLEASKREKDSKRIPLVKDYISRHYRNNDYGDDRFFR